MSEDLEVTASGGASSRPEDVEEEFDEDVSEATVGGRKRPPVVGPVEELGGADDVHGLKAGRPGDNGRGVGKHPGIGKLHGTHPPGRKPEERGDEKEPARGEGKPKVTLCHKGKNTLTVGAPAQEAHLRHGDILRVCP